MRLILEPSRLKLYISPCGSITKAMVGLVTVSILAAQTDACLDDRGKHQKSRSLPAKFAGTSILFVKATKGCVDLVIDLRRRGRLTGLRCRDEQIRSNIAFETLSYRTPALHRDITPPAPRSRSIS